MPDEHGFTHVLQVRLMAVAALLAECSIVYGGLRGLGLGYMLTAHLIVIAGLAAWCRWSPGLRADVRIPLLLAAGTAALGPVGAAGALVTISLSSWFGRNAIPFEEWYASPRPT
jgi:hypothetical protein